jgi:hypothetical protein
LASRTACPSGIDFQWKRWIESGWVDEVYLRTSWFEAAEDPLGAKSTVRSRLTRALADPVAEDMIHTARAHGLPITLNRYIGRAAGLEEYLDDLSFHRARRTASPGSTSMSSSTSPNLTPSTPA